MGKKSSKQCPQNSKPITLWHGTSLKRANSIVEKGFADTRELPSEMREGMGGVGEHGVTYFFVKSDEKETYTTEGKSHTYNPSKSGVYHHAFRVAKDDNDQPAVVEVKACLFNNIDDTNKRKFVSDLKHFAENKVEKGDKRWFRTYSLDPRLSVMYNIQSVATNNLSMREIMDEMQIDALFENEKVLVLANPKKNILQKKILQVDKAWLEE